MAKAEEIRIVQAERKFGLTVQCIASLITKKENLKQIRIIITSKCCMWEMIVTHNKL